MNQRWIPHQPKAEENELSSFDIQKIAIEEEYKIFSSNKVVTMYRRGMAFLMADIKGKTDKFTTHSVLKSSDSKEESETKSTEKETPSTHKTSSFGGFQTALQLSKANDVPKRKEVENKGNCKILHHNLHLYSIYLFCHGCNLS